MGCRFTQSTKTLVTFKTPPVGSCRDPVHGGPILAREEQEHQEACQKDCGVRPGHAVRRGGRACPGGAALGRSWSFSVGHQAKEQASLGEGRQETQRPRCGKHSLSRQPLCIFCAFLLSMGERLAFVFTLSC